MKKFSNACIAMLAAATALPTAAYAQDEPTDGITISGSATVVSDYRFRGFSQSNEKAAIQGGFTVAHDSGFYVGTWGSSIGFGGDSGAGAEIDGFVGFAKEISSGVTADVGVTSYFYPGIEGATTIIEPYFSLSGDLGPAAVKAGVAWAPKGQDSLGDYSSVYVYGDVGYTIPDTPIKLKGHVGYAKSDSFLGGNDGSVLDYSLGAEVAYKSLTLGVSYVDTDVSTRFIGGSNNKSLYADDAFIFSLGVAF